jgi:hypothetical protein
MVILHIAVKHEETACLGQHRVRFPWFQKPASNGIALAVLIPPPRWQAAEPEEDTK